jgi:hypothetical protein
MKINGWKWIYWHIESLSLTGNEQIRETDSWRGWKMKTRTEQNTMR